MDEPEIGLRDLLRVLRRRLWLLLLLPAALAGAAAWGSAQFLEPEYTASTTLWVVQSGHTEEMDYNTLLLNRDLAHTFTQVIRSRIVAQEAIRFLNSEGITPEELLKRMHVATVGDTAMIQVSVSDSDPNRAAGLTQAVVLAFMDRVGHNVNTENVVVVDPAQVPEKPTKPNLVLNAVVAAFLGGGLAVGLIFLREYLDTSLRSVDDVSRRVGLPVLAEIPSFRPVRVQGAPAPRAQEQAQAQAAEQTGWTGGTEIGVDSQ